MQTFYANDTITPLVITPRPANKFEAGRGKVVPEKYSWFIMLVISVFVAFIAFIYFKGGSFFAGLCISLFGLLFFYLSIITFLRFRISRQVAAIMKREAKAIHNISGPQLSIPPALAESQIASPFQLDVYEQNELPDPVCTKNDIVTPEKNIFNVAPYRILYFYNFFASNGDYSKISTMSGWRRHGTVYFLGSPHDIAINNTYSFAISKIVKSALITNNVDLEKRLANGAEQPIPPKTKGLMIDAFFSGAYPTHTFLCTDGIWQKAVELLFEKTDVALIDASDYNPERKGLIWEISQIINHIATEKFVVLINEKTDIVSLGNEFKNAWNHMSSHSPNNREKAGPVRFVLMQKPELPDDESGENSYEPDPDYKMPKEPGLRDIGRSMKVSLLNKYHQETVANDKIFAMLMDDDRN